MSITVLLADDHVVMLDGLRVFLERQPDIQVLACAKDGREAVRQVEHLSPQVAILDITMPELNGIEATRQICAISPATRVIILSMHCTTSHIIRALQAGARGYLLKESAGTEVVQAVRSVHAGHRYLSPKISDQVIDYYLDQKVAINAESPLERLSPREREILQLVVEGKTSSEIGELLFISAKTVDSYRSRLMEKLGLKDLPSLVMFAIQQGLISVD
jgi:RNA polymerase sigma factor (sigma-70 family)